jgi:NAD(P)-dependent dehydrogenase (short-subunit alcohol dehydrogenase family)
MTISGRTVVIAGASGALGSTLAHELGAAGANLALLERSEEKLAGLVASLELPDERTLTHVVDLLDPGATEAAAEHVAQRFGRVDALLHLVGGWVGGKTLLETEPADLDFMLNQHARTTFNALRAFVPRLQRNGWGRVVIVSTPLAARPGAKNSAYVAGKAAQEALMLTLAHELKGSGVTANLLLVNAIDAKREKLNAPAASNASWSTPEELSAAVMFLLSDAAGTINGVRMAMTGSPA